MQDDVRICHDEASKGAQTPMPQRASGKKYILHAVMPAFVLPRVACSCLVLCCLVSVCLPAWSAPDVRSQPVPSARVDLVPLGYKPLSPRALASGESLETVDFIDATHLLITFNQRKLIARLHDDPEGDRDRMLRAVVVHLPDGKVTAEAEWRTHDRERYLWPLADGRFLLRLGNAIALLAPRGAQSGEELQRYSLLVMSRRLRHVQVAADGQTIAVESSKPEMIGDDPDEPVSKRPVQLDLYTFHTSPYGLEKRGTTPLPGVLHFSFTDQGYLVANPEKGGTWAFDLSGFHGENLELAGVQTSCRPEHLFVSPTEFIVSACRTGEDRGMLGAFNLRGEVLWMQGVPPPHGASFSLAPNAGRFAMRGTSTDIDISRDESFPAGQEVRVFQTYSGAMLLRAECAPIQKADQNFALSDDGMQLAVWSRDAINIYPLPALSAKDADAVKQAHQPVVFKK